MKRALAGIAVVGLAAGLLAYVYRGTIATRLMTRAIERTLAGGRLADLPDGLHVGLCGAGAPLPDAERSGPCVAIVAGRALWIVDAGSGSARVLARMGLPPGAVAGVFLTHFHSDHIDGLGELMLQRWAGGGHTEPLPVFGPPGVENVVDGFTRAYRMDARYRVAHHGPQVVPPRGAGGVARRFAVPAAGESAVVLAADALTVRVFPVAHEPAMPAVGYRFEYGGRSIVVSGDTTKSATVAAVARGADVLVHEALSPALVSVMEVAAARAGQPRVARIARDIVGYHTTPVEAAEVARDAGVRHLVFYHIVPPLPLAPLREIFLAGVSDVYAGPVTLGRDGTWFTLPADSDAIRHDELL